MAQNNMIHLESGMFVMQFNEFPTVAPGQDPQDTIPFVQHPDKPWCVVAGYRQIMGEEMEEIVVLIVLSALNGLGYSGTAVPGKIRIYSAPNAACKSMAGQPPFCQGAHKVEFDGRGAQALWLIPYRAMQKVVLDCGHLYFSVALDVSDLNGLEDSARRVVETSTAVLSSAGSLTCCITEDPQLKPITAPPSRMDYWTGQPFTRHVRSGATFAVHAGKDKFYVHRIVIWDRSAYFKTLFANENMKEGDEECIVFKDIDSGSMRRLLLALYDHRLVDEWEMSFDVLAPVYQLANRFQVPSVMVKVRMALREMPIDSIDESNLCDVIIFAGTYGMEEIIRRCCQCPIQKDLPRDFWKVGQGRELKARTDANATAGLNTYVSCLEKKCVCGPPMDIQEE